MPSDCAMYFNQRTEVWGLMRDWLKAGAQIPDDPELAVDLCSPGCVGSVSTAPSSFESKDDLKARGEASPDDGDTLAMTFAIKVAAKARPKYQNLIYSHAVTPRAGCSDYRGPLVCAAIS